MNCPSLAELVRIGGSDLKAQYGDRLSLAHLQAVRAITGCRGGAFGHWRLDCPDCEYQELRPRSCGHRSCPQCQYHTTVEWLERQSAKLLPVDYFMVTFTLPAPLRAVAMAHQEVVYDLLIKAAAGTLQTFGQNHKLHVELGLCAVLHTHSRRLDFHPHVHIVVPGGGIDKARKQWKAFAGHYLFNEFHLAKVFRARLLRALTDAGIKLPHGVATKWVVDCKNVGRGRQALEYLSRYLYRGVIRNRQIRDFDPVTGTVTFSYIDAETRTIAFRCLPIVEFLWKLMQHVLPRGFHRVREYGFVHANARKTLKLVQWVLRVLLKPAPVRKPACIACPHCHMPMRITALRLPKAVLA